MIFERFDGDFSLEKDILPILVDNYNLCYYKVENDNFIDIGIPDDYKKIKKMYMDKK